MIELKKRLDEQSFDKLKEVIKRNTDIQNIDETNIKVIKEAIKLLRVWLEEVYLIDQPLQEDDSGLDIEKLFKG